MGLTKLRIKMSSCNRTLTRPEIVPNTGTSVCCGDKRAKLTHISLGES